MLRSEASTRCLHLNSLSTGSELCLVGLGVSDDLCSKRCARDDTHGSLPDLDRGLMSKRKRAVHKDSKLRPHTAAQKPNRKQQRQKPQAVHKQRKNITSVHYLNDSHQILCVGEGNFSFARALVRLFESSGDNLIATAYDSEETVKLKYEVSQACSSRSCCSWPYCSNSS